MSSFFAFLLSGMALFDAHYQQPPELARWQLSADPFACELQQTMPGLGQISFVAKPTEPLKLLLSIEQPNLVVTEASVTVIDAAWQAAEFRRLGIPLGASVIINNTIEFLEHPLLLLQQLHLGYWLQFNLQTGQSSILLTLSSIEGRQSVNAFRQCVARMAPMLWLQARDTQLEMAKGQRVLSPTQRQQIKDLVHYLQFDPAVKRVLIDGHADDTGEPLADRLLSRERADDLAAYFLELGVSASKLEVRAHGNRYPVAANQPNRRIVIRLVR